MRFDTFEGLCIHKGWDPLAALPTISHCSGRHGERTLATFKLDLLFDELNEGHEFNWSDRSEKKWVGVFDMEKDNRNPTGFRFHFAGWLTYYAHGGGGSRRAARTEDDFLFAGKAWEDLFRIEMTF
jgi:hypothetical protein